MMTTTIIVIIVQIRILETAKQIKEKQWLLQNISQNNIM